MAVSKRLRFEILRRDDYTCRYCGRQPPEVALCVDHVIPQALGGSDDPSNLTAACRDCNTGKDSVPPDAPLVARVEEDAERWRAAILEARFYAAVERDTVEQHIDEWGEVWESLSENRRCTRIANWRNSIRIFMEMGVPTTELHHLVGVTMGSKASTNQKWTYFCGCCWKYLRSIHEEAERIVRAKAAS